MIIHILKEQLDIQLGAAAYVSTLDEFIRTLVSTVHYFVIYFKLSKKLTCINKARTTIQLRTSHKNISFLSQIGHSQK